MLVKSATFYIITPFYHVGENTISIAAMITLTLKETFSIEVKICERLCNILEIFTQLDIHTRTSWLTFIGISFQIFRYK